MKLRYVLLTLLFLYGCDTQPDNAPVLEAKESLEYYNEMIKDSTKENVIALLKKEVNADTIKQFTDDKRSSKNEIQLKIPIINIDSLNLYKRYGLRGKPKHITEITEYKGCTLPQSIEDTKFSKKGLMQEYRFGGLSTTKYFYDSSENLQKKIVIEVSPLEGLSDTTITTYTYKNNLIYQETEQCANKQSRVVTVYSYDKNDRVRYVQTSGRKWVNDNELRKNSYVTYVKLLDTSKVINEVVVFEGKDSLFHTLESYYYNRNDHLVKYEYDIKKGNGGYYTHLYKYNQKGENSEEKIYNKMDDTSSVNSHIKKCSFTYDKFNNWIKRTKYQDGKICEVTVRTIEYY